MKRLVILCDGSWLEGESPRVSNVRRLARLLSPKGPDGIPQLVHYCAGPGPEEGFSAVGPVRFGAGLDREIQSIYRFLVLNYASGDDIFLFGACRGAYVARSVIGMLRNAWLLSKANEALIPQAYHVYRTTWGADAENARDFRDARARELRIRFLGVWDTVGELGIPLALFPGFDASRHLFHDTRLSRIIDHACHALAIDERRASLPPSIWRTRQERTRTEQAWFSGSHADVCGGPRASGLATLTLRWMIAQAESAGLRIDQAAFAESDLVDADETVHGWIPPLQRSAGLTWREIGRRNPDETLHPSAEQRFLREPEYRPRNLREYLARDEQIRLPL